MSQDRHINNNIYPAPNEPEEGEILAPSEIIQNKFQIDNQSFNLNQKMNSTDCKILTYKNPFIPGSQSLGVLSNSGQNISIQQKDQDFGETKNFQPAPFMGSYGQGSMFQTEDYNLDPQHKSYDREYAQNEHEEPEPESVEDNQDQKAELYENRQYKIYEENCDNATAEEAEEEFQIIDNRQRLKVPQQNFEASGEEAELAELQSDQLINGDDTISHDEIPKSRPIGIDFGVMSPNAGLNNDMVMNYSESSQQEQGDFINDSQSQSPSCQSENESELNNLNQYNNFYKNQDKIDDSDYMEEEKQSMNKNQSFQSVEKLDEEQKQNFSQDQLQKIENTQSIKDQDENKIKACEVPNLDNQIIPDFKDQSQAEESQVATESKQKPKKAKVIHEATRKSIRNCLSFQSTNKQNQRQETESQFEVPEIILEESMNEADKDFQNLDSKTGRSLRSRKNIDYSEQKSFNKTPAAKGLTEKAKVTKNMLEGTSEKSDAGIQTSKKKRSVKEIQDFSDVMKEQLNDEEAKQTQSRRGGSSKKNTKISKRSSTRRSKRASIPEIQEKEPVINESQNQSPLSKLKNSQQIASQKSDYNHLSMTFQKSNQQKILELADDKIPDVKLVSQRKSQIKEQNNLSSSQNDEYLQENNINNSENQNIYELQNIEESDEDENLEPYWIKSEQEETLEKDNQSNEIDEESSVNPGTALPIVQLSSSESSNNLIDQSSDPYPNKYSEKQEDQSAEKYNAFAGIDLNDYDSKIEGQSNNVIESEQSQQGKNKFGFRQIGPSKIQLEAKSSIDEDQSNDSQKQSYIKSSFSEEPTPSSSSNQTPLDQEIIDQLQKSNDKEQSVQDQEIEVTDNMESVEDNQSKSEQTTEEEQDSLIQNGQELQDIEEIQPNEQKNQNSPIEQDNIEYNFLQNSEESQKTKSFQKLFSLKRGKAKSIQKMTENQKEENEQKKRGRPKKDEIKQQQENQISQPSDDQINKKRGRPRKSNEEQKKTDETIKDKILQSEEIKKQKQSTNESNLKKRGRPSKSKDQIEELKQKMQKLQEENIIQKVKEIKEEKKESLTKKRARRQKQKEEEKPLANEIKEEEEIQEQPAKNKRGKKQNDPIVDEPIDTSKSVENQEITLGFLKNYKKKEVGTGEKLVSFGFGFTDAKSDDDSSVQLELPLEKPQINKVKQVSKGTDPDPQISFQLGFQSPIKDYQDQQHQVSPSKVRIFNKLTQTQSNHSRSVAVQVASKSKTLTQNKLQTQKPPSKSISKVEAQKPASKISQSKAINKVQAQKPSSKISHSKGINKVEDSKPSSKISQSKTNVSQSKKSDLRSGLRSQQNDTKQIKQEYVEKLKSKEKKRKPSPIQQISVSPPQKPSKVLGLKKSEKEIKSKFDLRSGSKMSMVQKNFQINKPSELPQKRKREIKQEEKKVKKTINLQIGKLEDEPRVTRFSHQNIPIKAQEAKVKKVKELEICKCQTGKRSTRENPRAACPGNCCTNNNCFCNIQKNSQVIKPTIQTKPVPQKNLMKRSFSLRNKQDESFSKQPLVKQQKKTEIVKPKEIEVMQTRRAQLNLSKNIEANQIQKVEVTKQKKGENLKLQKLEVNSGKEMRNKKKQEIVEKAIQRYDSKKKDKEGSHFTRHNVIMRRGRPSKQGEGSPIKTVLLSVEKDDKIKFGLFEPRQLKDKSIKIKKTATLRVNNLGFVSRQTRQPKYKL